MFCPKCGASNGESALFCSACGHSLNAPVMAQLQVPVAPSRAHPTYAGFWKRFGANLIDGFVINIASSPLFALIPWNTATVNNYTGGVTVAWGWLALLSLLTTVAAWLYHALMESSPKRATLGKMALGIVVTDYEGRRISFGKATVRYFGTILSAITFFIGYLMVIWTAKKQCLHDILAGTLVVNEKGQS